MNSLRKISNSAHPKSKNKINKLFYYGVMLIAGILRIVITNYRGPIMVVLGGYDDFLMLQYSDFSKHFSQETPLTLLKYLGFPWFENLLNLLNISFNTVIGITWILAALSVWFVIKKVSNKRLAILAYLFVLFTPQGFDFTTGVRLYRNLIIAPSFYILFSLMVLLILSFWTYPGKKRSKTIQIEILIEGILLSLVFPFVFFIKEDSFWMKPLLYLFIAAEIAGLLFIQRRWIMKNKTRILIPVIVILMPVLVFEFQSDRYLDANEKAFNYREYTLRTNGEVAGFINRVYKIASDNRTFQIWAPKDALEKAVTASPTLNADEQMKDLILHSHWTNGGENEIRGDFLSWVMMSAFERSEQYNTAEKFNAYFKTVNEELDQAFKNGSLQKDDRIQITASAGGRSFDELGRLFPPLFAFYNSLITLQGYNSDSDLPVTNSEEIAPYRFWLGQDIVYPETEAGQNLVNQRLDTGKSLAEADFFIYRLILPILFAVGFCGWLNAVYRWIRSGSNLMRKQKVCVVLVFFLVGLGIGYTIGIIWFSQFLYADGPLESVLGTLIFYASGSSVLLYLPLWMAVSLWRKPRKKRLVEQKKQIEIQPKN